MLQNGGTTNIFRFDFYEPELVHPASLDFIGSLPNLISVRIFNPSVIGEEDSEDDDELKLFAGDDMFLELPELCSAPFPKIETIEYEGQINQQVLSYLTLHSPHLTKLHILSSQSVLKATCLHNLHLEPKMKLNTLLLEFVLEADSKNFVEDIRKIIDLSPSLNNIGRFICLCRQVSSNYSRIIGLMGWSEVI